MCTVYKICTGVYMKKTNEQATRIGQSSYLQLVLSHWEMGEEASSLTRSMARDSRAAWEASLLRINKLLPDGSDSVGGLYEGPVLSVPAKGQVDSSVQVRLAG